MDKNVEYNPVVFFMANLDRYGKASGLVHLLQDLTGIGELSCGDCYAAWYLIFSRILLAKAVASSRSASLGWPVAVTASSVQD